EVQRSHFRPVKRSVHIKEIGQHLKSLTVPDGIGDIQLGSWIQLGQVDNKLLIISVNGYYVEAVGHQYLCDGVACLTGGSVVGHRQGHAYTQRRQQGVVAGAEIGRGSAEQLEREPVVGCNFLLLFFSKDQILAGCPWVRVRLLTGGEAQSGYSYQQYTISC